MGNALFRRALRLWRRFETAAGLAEGSSTRAFFRLFRAYSSSTRAYHDCRHVVDVVDGVTRMGRGLPSRSIASVLAAAWYHDVVYDSRRGDNEERSAGVMASEMRRCGLSRRAIVKSARLVMVTKRHSPSRGDAAGKVLADADLSTLSARADRYDAYVADIRREYAWVPADRYRAGRAAVLRSFAGRRSIYHTRRMHRREGAARANVEREIRALSD